MKNNFLKSTIILIIGGFFTKILGLIIKVVYSRILGVDGVSLFSLVMPTYSLLLTLANFNIQTSITKRISSKKSPKKVLINSLYIMFFLNLILILIFIPLSKYISFNLLKNKDTYIPLLACTLTLPFVSLGYIIKGYFYGKQNITPHMISNVLEQAFRFLIISLILPKIIKYGVVLTVSVLISFNILSESFSILVLYLFLPKHFKLKKQDLVLDKEETHNLLNISLVSISGRLLGNIGYFLEPIILTNILLFKGFNYSYIMQEYGIYNGYSISLLLFPSFFIVAISNSLMPEVSKFFEEKKTKLVKKRIKEATLISLIVGIICTLIIYLFKEKILLLLYNTNEGINYINILTPFFILFYLESPLSSALLGLNKIKSSSFISVSGIIIKLLTMTILCLLGLGIYSLIIAEIVNILYVTILDIFIVIKSLRKLS